MAKAMTLRGRTWVSDPGCSRRRGEGHPSSTPGPRQQLGQPHPSPLLKANGEESVTPPRAIPALPTQSCVPPDTSHLPRASLPLLQGRGNRGPLAVSRGDSDHGPAPPSGKGHLVMWSQAALATCPPSARADCHKGGDTKAGHKARHGNLQASARQPLARAWGPRAPMWPPWGV